MPRFMVIESFKSGKKPLVYERLAARGRMLPRGLNYINSWLERDGERCFQLMETEDEDLFLVWITEWQDLVDFEIVPLEPGS